MYYVLDLLGALTNLSDDDDDDDDDDDNEGSKDSLMTVGDLYLVLHCLIFISLGSSSRSVASFTTCTACSVSFIFTATRIFCKSNVYRLK